MYPSGRPFEFNAAPGTQHMIRFDGTFLENVAAAQLGAIPGPLQFRNLPPGTDRASQTGDSCGSTRAAALRNGRWRRAAVNMLVAEATVDAFTPPPDVDIVFHDGPATMRFAQRSGWSLTLIDTSPALTFAQAAGINARALQAAFQRHADTTPMAFLRQIRLHRVRAQLVAGEAPTTVIAGRRTRLGLWTPRTIRQLLRRTENLRRNDIRHAPQTVTRDSAATQNGGPDSRSALGHVCPRADGFAQRLGWAWRSRQR